MGCISSKIATRSRSFREEFSQSLQRRINGLPILDDLLISKDGGDQFLALVCTANTASKKLQTGIPPSKSNTDGDQPVEHMNPETIYTSELLAGIEEEQQRQQSPSPHREEGHNDQAVAAEDFHKSNESTLASGGKCTMISNSLNVVAEGVSVGDAGVLIRSRSFHTVEEYDALVRAMQSDGVAANAGAHLEQFNNFNIGKANGSIGDNILHIRSKSFHALGGSDTNRLSEVGGDTKSSSGKSTLHSQHIGIVKKDDEFTIKDRYIPLEDKESSTNSFKNLEPKNIDMPECPGSTCTTDVVSINEDISKKANIKVEKGIRRKVMAKELTTLSIPTTTTVDFPVIGSLGEWLEPDGQVFSPGDYVTPRFGNFNVPISVNGNNGRAIFDPEMVAAFEEAMKELTVEEECILKQIEEDVDEEGKIAKEVESKISKHIRV